MEFLNRLLLVSLTTLWVTACGGSNGNGFVSDSIGDSSTGTDTISDSTSPIYNSSSLSEAEIAGLFFMREEEELARDLYLNIYEATGLNTFKNISEKSETVHADAMKTLLDVANLPDPSTGERDTYSNPELQEAYNHLYELAISSDEVTALRVGAYVEETDIRDIQFFKDQVSAEHQDIIDTYSFLLCGSRNHLRAFVKQIEDRTGTAYALQVPEMADEVNTIISSEKETCD